MGAVLGTDARLAPLAGRACGALLHWAPSPPARSCHSKAGLARPVPLKKRGYDVTRNPHLNKVMVWVWERAWERSCDARKGAPPRVLERSSRAPFQ